MEEEVGGIKEEVFVFHFYLKKQLIGFSLETENWITRTSVLLLATGNQTNTLGKRTQPGGLVQSG